MKNWPSVALRDIFEIARGGSPRPIQQFLTNDPNGINWIMISDACDGSKYITSTKRRILQSGVKRSRTVNPGDFLLTNSMSFGHPYIMQISGCIHDGWLVLSSKKDVVDQDYFYYLLGSDLVYLEFSRRASGSTVKNLNIDIVKSVKVPLPPITEQRRIAAILDKADAVRRKRKEAIALTEDLLRSAFLEMFGEPVKNEKGWPQKKIKEIGDVQLGRQRAPKYQSGKYTTPYLRVANVYEDRLKLSNLLSMDFTEKEKETYLLVLGDILLNEGQSTELVGRPAMWRDELPGCCFQNTLVRFRSNNKLVLPEYALDIFLWYLHAGVFAKISSKTSSVAHLGAARFGNMLFPLPPLSLQKEWQRLRMSLNKSKARLEEGIKDSENLFNSLLQHAFRGDL